MYWIYVTLKIIDYTTSSGIVTWYFGKEAEHSRGNAFLRATGANIQFTFRNQEMYSVGMTESEEIKMANCPCVSYATHKILFLCLFQWF